MHERMLFSFFSFYGHASVYHFTNITDTFTNKGQVPTLKVACIFNISRAQSYLTVAQYFDQIRKCIPLIFQRSLTYCIPLVKVVDYFS